MTVVERGVLEDFAHGHADIRLQLKAWLAEVEDAGWEKPDDVKQRYPSASILPNNRVVFNLKGNKYRLLVRISYKLQIVRVEKIGTHADYDKWEL